MSQIHSHQYDNGLVLLVEPMRSVTSASMAMLLPGGTAAEPADRQGLSSILAEVMLRGAGELDAKAHSDALDRLGVHRNSEPQIWHIKLSATMMGDRIEQAMPLVMDTVLRPQLTEAAFEPAVQLALQSLESLEDNPQEKVMIELRRQHDADPLGRSSYGIAEHLEAMTPADVRSFASRRFVPRGSVIGVAGNVRFEMVRDLLGELLRDWRGEAAMPRPQPAPPRLYHHLPAQSVQQHIGVAFDAPSARDEQASMLQRLATAVLSGGMSGRLFHEVREVRGLCYSVYAAYIAMRESGAVYAYAGTTAQRAAQTLEVLSGELRRLGDGVSPDEFQRAVVGMRSRLVMQGESTAARAGAIAGEQFLLGRPRTLEDAARRIEAVTLADLNRYVADHRPEQFTTLTIGPEPLFTAETAESAKD